MLNRIFGNYLIQNNRISDEELNSILASKKGLKANPWTICLITKVLSCSQVEELLQKVGNNVEEFSKCVVEDGYLTDDRFEHALSNSKNTFAVFVDLLVDKKIIAYNEVLSILSEIQKEKKWNDHQLTAMIHWDTVALVDMFVPLRSSQLKGLTITLVNSLKRLVDADVYLDKAFVCSSYDVRRYACQEMLGDFKYTLYIEGSDDNLLGISNYFSGLKFEKVDEDVLDNVGEFVNCINGQFASDMSYEDLDIDMAFPQYSMDGIHLHNCRIYVIPIHANGYEFSAVYEIHD